MRSVSLLIAVGIVLALSSGAARADSPPVGSLPKAKVIHQSVERGALVAVALPIAPGKVWRVARPYDASIVGELEERTLNSSIVIVLKTRARGRATITYALTAGETSSTALRAITVDLHVI